MLRLKACQLCGTQHCEHSCMVLFADVFEYYPYVWSIYPKAV
jgi:hypothetical protein